MGYFLGQLTAWIFILLLIPMIMGAVTYARTRDRKQAIQRFRSRRALMWGVGFFLLAAFAQVV